MKEGEVALTPIPQAGGLIKNRPVILLRALPRYGDFLVCGVSTQLDKEVKGFDDLISPTDDDFQSSGLRTTSLVRLGFLAVLPSRRIAGSIGSISQKRRKRLLVTLSNYLTQ